MLSSSSSSSDGTAALREYFSRRGDSLSPDILRFPAIELRSVSEALSGVLDSLRESHHAGKARTWGTTMSGLIDQRLLVANMSRGLIRRVELTSILIYDMAREVNFLVVCGSCVAVPRVWLECGERSSDGKRSARGAAI